MIARSAVNKSTIEGDIYFFLQHAKLDSLVSGKIREYSFPDTSHQHYLGLYGLVTWFAKRALIDVAIKNRAARAPLCQFLEENYHTELKKKCIESSEFKQYVSNNGIAALRAIFFEVKHFFREINLLPENSGNEKLFLKLIYAKIKDDFSQLCKQLGYAELDFQQSKEIWQFAKDFLENKQEALVEIIDFYKMQDMANHMELANQVLEKLKSIKENSTANKIKHCFFKCSHCSGP